MMCIYIYIYIYIYITALIVLALVDLEDQVALTDPDDDKATIMQGAF